MRRLHLGRNPDLPQLLLPHWQHSVKTHHDNNIDLKHSFLCIVLQDRSDCHVDHNRLQFFARLEKETSRT